MTKYINLNQPSGEENEYCRCGLADGITHCNACGKLIDYDGLDDKRRDIIKTVEKSKKKKLDNKRSWVWAIVSLILLIAAFLGKWGTVFVVTVMVGNILYLASLYLIDFYRWLKNYENSN